MRLEHTYFVHLNSSQENCDFLKITKHNERVHYFIEEFLVNNKQI